MKLATWNVNSIRARLPRLLAWLGRERPDVACLQELKVADDAFPTDELRDAGYHAAIHGQRTYNGVAILSRTEPAAVNTGLEGDPDDDQARLIAASLDGIRVISAYFPNGQTVGSDKWSYKLAWMRRLRSHLEAMDLAAEPVALCGDFNVAPEDRDVARPDEWRESVLCHDDARQLVREIADLGFVDAMRLHHEGPGPYSWWDYRRLAFPKGNGLRIDHIFLSRPLVDRCVGARVDRDERKGKQPSDHVPVVVELRGG